MIPKRSNSPWQEPFALPLEARGFAVASAGLITCVSNANMADSDYIAVGDGINPPILFEYDKSANGVTAGRTSVTAGAGTAAQTATVFYTALVAALPAMSFTDNGDGTITVAHKVAGAVGNVTITENVANAGFTVSGMSGGVNAGEYGSTTTIKLMTSKRQMRITKVEIINPAGLAGDASNYWTLALKKGSTTMASWSTATAAEGTLTANTPVLMTLSATDANLVTDVDDVLSLVLTKAASAANLPAGRVVVHGNYVS